MNDIVSVTERALVQRLNRVLRRQDQVVRTTRHGHDSRGFRDLGYHYILDFNRNQVVATHVDLEQLGRDLEVLHPRERATRPGEVG